MLLEICAYTIASCRLAAEAGADRVELCADPAQGGTTPSIGLVRAAMELGIPVFPMVRPRGGDFVYNTDEMDVMHRELHVFRELGCPGVVFGMLRADGSIHRDRMRDAVERAGPMAVTCHKAFDQVPDAEAALETLVDAGCARVLTSGLAADALTGAPLIARLVEQAAGRIVVMAGGGVRSGNIRQLMEATGAQEFHSSAVMAGSNGHDAEAQEVEGLVQALRKAGPTRH
jgi:copper homeostasis protein